MAANRVLAVFVVLSCFVATCYGSITFSSLQRTLVVNASPTTGQVVKAGEDNITLSWSFNTTFPTDADSTCQHKVVTRPYRRSNNTATWTVPKDVPGATYFVRAYVYNAGDHEVAYGQTTDSTKTTNLFVVKAVSGRHVSLDIASVCFSAFSIVSLAGFFYLPKL